MTTKIPETLARLRATFATGKTRPLEWRLQQLAELERMMREHAADFSEALQADLHKCRFETALSELGFVESETKYARRHLRRWARAKRVSTPMMAMPGSSYIQPEPKGVVLIIAPWNYPLSMVCAPLVGAIAAGNCAVMKPSEITTHTSAALARLVPRYLDNDAFAVVEGGVPETTELLEKKFDHILYTGNETVARIVMTAAAKHLTPVTLELGGKSPCLVDKSADLAVAASRIAWGKFINAGQTCVAPDHVLVHRSVAAEFTDMLAAKIKEFYGDDPRQSPDYCRIASERHAARFARLLEGQKIHTGGQVDVAQRYVAPTIVLDPAPDSELMQEEIFGPVLPVITVDDMHHAIKFVADRPKPLALYVFTEEQGARGRRAGEAQRRQRLHQRRRDLHGLARTAVRRHRQQRHGPLHGLVRVRDVQPHEAGDEAQLPLRCADALSAVQRLQAQDHGARALMGRSYFAK